MNFKKKDVKRASYYVWFLGAKESKGLRGDEYVQPVLNYLLDNECELEPSKVTLQVSGKGLKIIQILSVPRKSSKLNADQQLQLFVASNNDASGAPSVQSSVMKHEQVKHHIPHDSISWVYQEDDVICAILLLYNPITRCPVHIHAYRCDSIQTANNLRQQLQTLVDRPENQKKFREIESRLAAKGLLIPPPIPPNGYHHGPGGPFDDDLGPHADSSQRPTPFDHHHHLHDSKRSYQNGSPSATKTLNSDGRSTRTDGSDEMNSEESNSSDLGYAIRPTSNQNFKSKSRDHLDHRFLRSSSKTRSGKYTPKTPNYVPEDLMVDPIFQQQQHPNLYDSLAAELRAKLGNPKMGPLLLPPRDYDSQKSNGSEQHLLNKQTTGVGGKKSKSTNKQANGSDKLSCHGLTRSESSGKSSSGIGSDEALCGNTNGVGSATDNHHHHHQILQRSYYFDSTSSKNNNNTSTNNNNSGKSRPSYLVSSDRENLHHFHHQQQHRDDISSGGNSNSGGSSSEDELEDEDESHFHHRGSLSHQDIVVDCLEVDVEDFEEDVIFTAPPPPISSSSVQKSAQTKTKSSSSKKSGSSSARPKSKSTFDLADPIAQQTHPQQQQQHIYRQKHLFHQNSNRLSRDHSVTDLLNVPINDTIPPSLPPFTTTTSSSSWMNQNNKNKLFSSNPNLEPMSLQPKSPSSPLPPTNSQRLPLKDMVNNGKRKDSSVIGRREQRFSHCSSNGSGAINPPLHSKSHLHRNESISAKPHSSSVSNSTQPAQKFYFADAEFAGSSKGPRSSLHHSNGNYRGRSMGRLDQSLSTTMVDIDYGPMSLNFPTQPIQHQPHPLDMNDRSVSPYFVQTSPFNNQQQHVPPSSSNYRGSKSQTKQISKSKSQKFDPTPPASYLPEQQLRQKSQSRDRLFLDQPYSRYSYIDIDHHNQPDSLIRLNSVSNQAMMIRGKR